MRLTTCAAVFFLLGGCVWAAGPYEHDSDAGDPSAADATPPAVDAASAADAALRLADATPAADAGLNDATVDAEPPPADAATNPVAVTSDFFDVPVADLLVSNPTSWSLLHPDRAASIGVANGRLAMVALAPEQVGAHNGWYQDDYGPLVYKSITGNFAVAVRLRVTDPAMPTMPPPTDFHAGGLVIRDPAGTYNGDENWVMYNMGRGVSDYQREIKKTASSISGLYLNPQTFAEQALLVCRVSSRFYFFHWDTAGQQWVVERYQPGVTVQYVTPIAEVDTSGSQPMYFDDQLPATVQVGLMSHAWSYGGTSGTLASFDWVAFAATPPATLGDCTGAFAGLDLP